jgi:hypothetical protein
LIGSRVPFRNVLVPHEKIVHYLLDLAHPDGGSKATFFSAPGFRPDDPKALADALLERVATNPVVSIRHGRSGAQLAVEGRMPMPDGTSRNVLSVLRHQETGDGVFVTAYPQS